jgi:hypothetical protein
VQSANPNSLFAIRYSIFPIVCAAALLAPAVAAPPTLEVARLDGQVAKGRLLEFAPEIVLQTDTGRLSSPWSEVLSVRPIAEAAATRPAAADFPLRFELADGSAFGGRIEAAGETGLTVRFAANATSRLDLSMIRSITAKSAAPAAREKLNQVLADAQRLADAHGETGSPDLSDTAVVARGTEVLVLRGRVRRLAPDNVTFDWNGRELPLPWERVAGLLFARPSPRSAACMVRMRGGDVFGGQVAGGSDESVVLHSGILSNLELAWAGIERIDCRSERLVFLSDIKPKRYDFEPFFDKTWDFATDRSLTGKPIRLGGREYARGIVMHSRAALTYRLDGRFEQFAAVAGILDEMDQRGCVGMSVIGDGRVLWQAVGVRGGQPPREILVDVAGVQELTLGVDFDQELDLSDHAAWAFARLIR